MIRRYKPYIIFTLCVILLVAFCRLFFSGKSFGVISHSLSKTIIIDAGHGFPDGGAIGKTGSIESELNLKVASVLEKLLKKKGYKIIMTRSNKNALSDSAFPGWKKRDMYKRLGIMQNSNADIYVSIHMNYYPDSYYSGSQVLYGKAPPQSHSLAKHITAQLIKIKENTSRRSELCAPGSIFLLKNATIPAVIVECGFISNYNEEKLLNTNRYRKSIAEAIAKGIENYYKSISEREKI